MTHPAHRPKDCPVEDCSTCIREENKAHAEDCGSFVEFMRSIGHTCGTKVPCQKCQSGEERDGTK